VAAPKKNKRKRIAPINRDTKFKKLRALNCFGEVVQRLKEGWPTAKLAAWVQEDQKEYLDVELLGLRSILQEYRKVIPAGEVVQATLPRFVEQQMTKVEEGFDELAELQNLYKLQMKRIKIDADLENKFKKLMPSVTQEMRTAREILSTIAELKMDLGLNDRKMGTVNVDARIAAHVEANFGNARVAGVLADAEKRQRLTGLVKLLAKKADKSPDKKKPVIVIDVPVEETFDGYEDEDAIDADGDEYDDDEYDDADVIDVEAEDVATNTLQGESAHP